MDSPPIPKPRTTIPVQNDPNKRPVPLPRTKTEKSTNNEKITATEILRSIGTVSKQITDDMAQIVQNSAKNANEKFENAVIDGTKLAKESFERTLTSSRNVRDKVTKSVIESTKSAGHKLRGSNRKIREQNKRSDDVTRSVSMPSVDDVTFFDNLQFHSPLLEQKKHHNNPDANANVQRQSDILPLNLNLNTFDDMSLYSDSNIDSVSNFSYDSREHENSVTNSMSEIETGATYDTPKDLRALSRQNSITPCLGEISNCPPDQVERRSIDSFGFFRQNSAYENWNLPLEKTSNTTTVSRQEVSKSTIIEFDPLKTKNTSLGGKSNELLLLEYFLSGDNYGTHPARLDDDSSSLYSPPTPPERFDSLPEEGDEDASSSQIDIKSESKTNWFVSKDTAGCSNEVKTRNRTSSNNMMHRFSNMLKFDTLLKNGKEKCGTVERPQITSMPVVFYSGLLTRIISGGVEDLFKNSQSRYCVLSDQKMICYADTTNSIVKEAYPLNTINSLQIVLPLSVGTAENVYCFELNVSTSGGLKGSNRKVLFSCNSSAERRNWAQKIVEHLTDGFPVKYTAEFTRFGWCYVKEGVNSEWQGVWLMLIRRILVYCTTSDPNVKTVDLRKTWCVVTQEADEATKESCPSDVSANLLLDNPHLNLYVRFQNERELKGWRYMIKLAALNNGDYIHHQQLTKENIPAIVDKCINFIYAHGSMSEGIYRRAGSSVVLAELLGRFRRDAWSVRLSKNDHTEHDVAGTLKRFFRELPEPLIPQSMHDRLVDAFKITEIEARCLEYATILNELPTVARETTRKLFAHLHFIHTLRDTNKMTSENLASVWAPTIMPAAIISNTLQMAWSTKEVNVIRDLISFYPTVYRPSTIELERERTMLSVLRRVANSSAPAPQRSAGDLMIWVYLGDRAEGRCENVTLTPSKTCGDVCAELCGKLSCEPHTLMLQEVVCGDSMRRCLHHDEVLLDLVLRWGYWDEQDRITNYLLIKDNKVLRELEGLRGSTTLVCGELKFASDKSKSFKLHTFELKNSKLCYFKDKQGSSPLGEWNVKDYLWYEGHELKRNPQSRWSLTFIPKSNKPKRCKDKPWLGCTIAGSVGEDELRWMAAILFAQHAGSLLPAPRLIIT